MIDSLDQSLGKLLQEKVPLPVSSAVSFDPPSRDWSDARDKITVNLYLYDIRENHELRTPAWTTELMPDGTVTRVRPKGRIDLWYLVTAWSASSPRDVLEEHRMLGEVLRTLLRFPTLPADVLLGEMVGQEPPLPAMVAQPDGPANPGDIWSALGNRLSPALTLVVTISVPPSAYLDMPVRLIPTASRSLLFGAGTAPSARLSLRPALVTGHPADEPVIRTRVDTAVAARLAAAVFPAADVITVADGGNLAANAWIVVDGGDESDFVFVREAPGSGPRAIPVDPPLRFPHPAGAVVGKAAVATPALTTLTDPAAAGASALSVANGDGLTNGQWLFVADAQRGEFVRLDAPGTPGPAALRVRRPLAFDHPSGCGLRPVTITTAPAVTALRDPVNQSAASIQLDAAGTLVEGTVVMVGSGTSTEFCRLGPVPAGPAPVVPVQPSLHANHATGTPLRGVTDGGQAGTLALTAQERDTDVTIAAERAAQPRPGDVIGLGPPPRAYHQITSAAAEPGGITRVSDVLVQIAGTVTDDADPPEAIAGAMVQLAEPLLVATTDGQGRFVFTNLPPATGTLTLRAAATGYLVREKQVHIPAQRKDEYLMRLSTA